MNWWTESGIAGKECSGKEGEASRLKSTTIDAPLSEVERSSNKERYRAMAPLSEVERSSNEERYRAMALRNESGRGRVALARPAGPTLKCGPRSPGRCSLVVCRPQFLGWFTMSETVTGDTS